VSEDDGLQGAIEWEPIDLGPRDGRYDDYSEQVSWLDDDEVDGGARRADERLPPHTTRERILVTVLAFGLCLAGIGAVGTVAYDRHMTARRNASVLRIQDGPGELVVNDVAALSFEPEWNARPPETISVGVVNQGPDPVTLVSALLSEPGLIGSARLVPHGDARVAPGKEGTLDGTVIADCTLPTGLQTTLSPAGVLQGEFAEGTPVLSVSAETLAGTTDVAKLNPESTSGLDLQQRICGSQGYQLLQFGAIATAVNRGTRTITLQLPIHSAADDDVDFSVQASYTDNPADSIPGLTISQPEAAPSSTAGVIDAQASVTPTYTVKISSCPTYDALLPLLDNQVDQVQFEFSALIKGTTMEGSVQDAEIDTLIAQACGLSA
jgi:hypothetical protein